MELNKIIQGDSLVVLKTLPSESVDSVITSPPYFGLRDYGVDLQIGLEQTPELYVEKLVSVFREVKRVLKKEGTFWLNLGDSYSGSGGAGYQFGDPKKPRINHFDNPNKKVEGLQSKNLIGIPWRVAFALQSDGWYLRQDIIWAKPNPMPESVTDRCTKSHEYIFLLTKSPKYYFDNEAIKEKSVWIENRPSGVVRDREFNYDSKQKAMGRHKNTADKGQSINTFHKNRELGIADEISEFRNKRSVWVVTTKAYREAHFATFPEALIEPMVLAGCPKGGIILDPFMGAGTTAIVSKKLGRNFIGVELNPAYIKIAEERIKGTTPPLF